MTTFATPVQPQPAPRWQPWGQPWEHKCGFVLLLRTIDGAAQWKDDFEDVIVSDCPKCGDPLDVRDGG